jgi:hypothetical protein
MTSPPIPGAAPAWLRELVAARTNYEELLGWSPFLQVSKRRLLMPLGQTIDAITMPAALGADVQFQLQVMMLDGPVIAGLGSDLLTFVIEPSTSTSSRLPAEFECASVRVVSRAEHLVLPIVCTVGNAGDVWWFNPPRPRRPLPARSVVVGVSRRVISCQTVDHSASHMPSRLVA